MGLHAGSTTDERRWTVSTAAIPALEFRVERRLGFERPAGPAARATLDALGLASQPAALAPARAPPQVDLDWAEPS